MDVGAARRREIELGKKGGQGVGVGPEESRWYPDHLTDDQILEIESRDLGIISRPYNSEVEIDNLTNQELSLSQGQLSSKGSLDETLRRERQRENEAILKRSSREKSYGRQVSRNNFFPRQQSQVSNRNS